MHMPCIIAVERDCRCDQSSSTQAVIAAPLLEFGWIGLRQLPWRCRGVMCPSGSAEHMGCFPFLSDGLTARELAAWAVFQAVFLANMRSKWQVCKQISVQFSFLKGQEETGCMT